jgi:hypothetical protein
MNDNKHLNRTNSFIHRSTVILKTFNIFKNISNFVGKEKFMKGGEQCRSPSFVVQCAGGIFLSSSPKEGTHKPQRIASLSQAMLSVTLKFLPKTKFRGPSFFQKT